MIIDLGYRGMLRPLLFRAYGGDPERVHEETLEALSRIGRSRPARVALAALCARHRRPATVAGIQFPGLVGLAAGMDKDGVAIKTWGSLGFERGALGLPTSGEIQEPQWIVQNFQHGTLNFDREKGTVTRVIDGVPLELPPPSPNAPPVQLERFTPPINPA